MATVLLEGIPRQVDKSDLVYAIRDLLHQPEFHSDIGRPPNFDVQLDRDPTDEFDHNGNGTLTIAADDMVVATFISIYGEPDRPRLETESDWDQGELTFSLTSSSPAMDLVQELENSPFVDPHVAQGREARKRALGTTVDLRSVEFGWFCRDNRFSPEWQARVQTIGDLPVNTMPSLRFNADSNEIWISLGAASTDSMTRQAMVVIRFSRIEALLLDMAEPSTPGIIFTFLSPPALEMHENTENTFGEDIFGVNLFNLFGDDKIRRYRLTAFGSTQERITPYTLFAMRVTCTSRVHLEEFRRMARVASLPRLTDSVPSPVVARALFSATTLDRIEGWLQQLPWSVAFQALSILNAAALDPLELWNLRPRIEALVSDADFGVAKAGEALRNFATKLKDPAALIQDEESIFRCFESVKADARRASPGSVRRIRNPGVFNCYHATVTPTRILLDGPFLDQSNRVLRQYPAHQEYFLRVNFTDEDKLQFRWDWEVDGASFVKERVGGILEQGLHIAGRHFEFLAYSNSALREHAVWFSATFQEPGGGRITAQSIRDGLGDFYWKNLERQPAKLAARMSQAFSATEPSVNLPRDDDMTVLRDIEQNGSVFTDGVGEISRALARRIVKALNKSGRSKRFFIRPSAFQFRMGGFKGVLMVNPDLKDNEIRLRDSQQKFLSPLADIEIAQVFYRAKPFYLNRFLIMILETLGVSAEVFLRLQGEAIREAEAAIESFAGCAGFLDTNGCGTSYHISSIFLHMSRLGLTLGGLGPMAVKDGFLNRSIRFAKNHVLREMKHKARIPVKGSYTLVGVADFTGYLPPNTIFACICLRDKKPFCVKGRVLISRSPQVHPGDVQFVEAIGRPPAGSPFEHESYKNCVVFSTQGERSVPSMLAGGDLDGDEYNLILDPSLFPPSCDPPAQYPPATVKTLDRPCVTKDLTDWVTDYINSDILGLVCHQFLITADFEEAEMCRHRNCITLAELASRAVDFAKSGTPVERRELPKGPKLKPDWSVGEFASAGSLNKGTYESQTAIGKLFRHIDLNRAHKDVARQANREHRDEGGEGELEASLEELETVLNNLSRPRYRGSLPHHSISEAIRSSLQQNYIDTDSPLNPEAMEIVRRIYPYYTVELRSLSLRHSITKQPLTEEEVIMGTIASRTSQPRQRKAMIQQMRTQADELVKHVQAELKEIGDRTELEPDDEDFATLQRRLQVAWLAWRLSVEQRKTFGAKSFGLIALNVIFDGMRAVDDWRAENETRLHIVGRDASMDTHSSPVNPLRDVPESSKASQQEPIHVILRAQANVEGDAMGRCARESQEAYTSGDRARAKELSNQKKLHKARMDELNREASEWIFNENNIDRPPYEIDLHGLYVKEALERMGPAIIEARERGDRQLHVIVGRGMHSHDSIGKLRMAIEYFMLEHHIACQPDPRNVGVLIVKLDEDED